MSEFKIVKNNKKYVSVCESNDAYRFDLHPLDSERSKPPKDLTEITSKCLKKKLERKGSLVPRSLLGLCNENAVYLMKKLKNSGYKPILCVGTGKSGSEKSIVDAFKNVKNVHQWIEVNQYVLEICSVASGSVGHMYVSQRRPSNYNIYYRLSYSQFNQLGVDTIKPSNIVSVIDRIES